MQLRRALRGQAGEQFDLGRRDERAGQRPRGHPPLECEQRARLAAVDVGSGPGAALGVLGPLLRVDVAEVGHEGRRAGAIEVQRHRGGKAHRPVDAVHGDRPVDPALQRRAAVPGQRQRFAAQQAGGAPRARHQRRQRNDLDLRAVLAQRVHVRAVAFEVGERAEVDAIVPAQEPQQVVRADLVALVGRIRQAVHEVEEGLHRHYLAPLRSSPAVGTSTRVTPAKAGVQRCRRRRNWVPAFAGTTRRGKAQSPVLIAAYPRFRTIDGPSALATLRGRRRHSAIMARYFGLAGLFCGIASPLKSWYS